MFGDVKQLLREKPEATCKAPPSITLFLGWACLDAPMPADHVESPEKKKRKVAEAGVSHLNGIPLIRGDG